MKFDLEVRDSPVDDALLSVNQDLLYLRNNLIREEVEEFIAAQTLVEKVDALADLLYVVYGAAVSFGVDLEPVFKEVHRSNMSKLWDETNCLFLNNNEYSVTNVGGGKCVVKRRIDGKVIKPATYSPANIKYEIQKQLCDVAKREPTKEENLRSVL